MPSPTLFPADGRLEVCPDMPLTMVTADLAPPRWVRIRSLDGADRIDLDTGDDGDSLRTIGDARDDRGLLHRFRYRAITPVERTGDCPGGYQIRPPRTLRPATDYRVEVDGLSSGWHFRTRAPLSSSARALRVAADGRGDFCTVQAAIDAARVAADRGGSASVPGRSPILIDVAAGNYREICFVTEDCPPMIIRGAGQGRTVLGYDNNDRRNGRPSDSRCRNRLLGDRDLYNGWRANVGVDAADVRFEDLTLINTTPVDGSQAEAFRGNQRRLVLDRVELLGHQDTLRIQGQAFLSHCRVAGTVDFVWGAGAVVHWRSEFRSRGAGYVFQVRNDADHRGHLLLDCHFTAEPDVDDHSVHIVRTDTTAFPYSELIMIGCRLGRHLHPDGGLISPDAAAETVRFAEHGSVEPSDRCQPVRLSTFRRLTPAEAAREADPADFLGGWVPYTINPETPQVPAGGAVAVHWSAPPDHDHHDRISIAGRSVEIDSRSTLGRSEIIAPTRPGTYRLEYRPRGRRHPAATAPLEVVHR